MVCPTLRSMRTVIALCALLVSPASAAAAAPSAQAIAETLVDLLRRDDVRALEALEEGSPAAFEDLREAIDKYDCITVDRFTSTIEHESDDRLVVRISAPASGATLAEWRPVLELPRTWYVEARRFGEKWRIVEVSIGERVTARQMLAAPSPADAQCILENATGVDRAYAILYYAYLVEPSHGIARADHAVSLARTLGDLPTEIFALRMQSLMRAAAGAQPQEIFAPARQAEELALNRGTADDLAEALFTVGLGHLMTGDLRRAGTSYRACGDLAEQVLDPIRPIKCMHMYAWTLMQQGDALATLRAGERVTMLAQRFGWTEGEVAALFLRGDVYTKMKNAEMRRTIYDAALRRSVEIGKGSFEAIAAHALAAIATEEGDLDTAIAHLRRAMHASSGDPARPLRFHALLADVYIRRHEYAEARTVLDEAEALADQTAFDESLPIVLATRSELALQLGDSGEAVRVARRAAGLVGLNRESDPTRATVLFQLGRVLRADGRKEEAVTVLRQAVATTENGRERSIDEELARAAYLDGFLRGYADLVELLVEQSDVTGAFRVAEQMKGRGLRDAIGRGRVDLSASMSDAERGRETELEQRVVDLNRTLSLTVLRNEKVGDLRSQLDRARGELDAFRSEMRAAHPSLRRRRFDEALAETWPESWHSLAVVEYVAGETGITAFIVTRGDDGNRSVRAVRLPASRETLERDANRLATLVSKHSLAYRASARRVYDLALAPLEPFLAGSRTICVIPDGALWKVPFHALIGPDDTHFVERHAVFYAHSLTLLLNTVSAPTARPAHLLAFGNPSAVGSAQVAYRSLYRDIPFGSLVHAEAEVRSVAAMYSPARSRAYYRGEARESVLKNEVSGFDIVHFAAHAIADDRAPMYSAIVMAADRGEASEDGLLEAREIADLPLDADLAVLSACDTARGKMTSGDGIIGLAWAFLAAGCPTTVVSQWKAESRATAILMIEFHRRLLAGDSTAEALRKAQVALRGHSRYRHPFYWAPFVAIGAAERSLQ